MLLYKNITADETQVLLSKGSNMGNIKSMTITNNLSLATDFKLFLRDVYTGGNPEYNIVNTRIPMKTTLYLDQSIVQFNSKKFEMKYTTLTSGGTTDMDIIIK